MNGPKTSNKEEEVDNSGEAFERDISDIYGIDDQKEDVEEEEVEKA